MDFFELYLQGATAWNIAIQLLPKDTKIDFSRKLFNELADFSGFTFPFDTSFTGAKFSQGAQFTNAKFSQNANFSETIENNSIIAVDFGPTAEFHGTIFKKKVWFNQAVFGTACSFGDATFEDIASFQLSRFPSFVFFDGATFKRQASFFGAQFENGHQFRGTAFEGPVLLEGAHFKEAPNFLDAKFVFPPRLDGMRVANPLGPEIAKYFTDPRPRIFLQMPDCDRWKCHGQFSKTESARN